MYENQKEELKKAAVRKSKREEKRQSLPWGRKTDALALGQNNIPVPKIKRKRKPKQTSSRRAAFNRLGANCRKYVLLRAQKRLGHCEVALACGGFGAIEVWYHIFPQCDGNALKYDELNILGSCNWCNALEYAARKSGSKTYEDRHRQILGKKLYEDLKSISGRLQISTAGANQMADRFEKMIKDEDF